MGVYPVKCLCIWYKFVSIFSHLKVNKPCNLSLFLIIVWEYIFSKDKSFILNNSDKYFSQSFILLIISSSDFSGTKFWTFFLYESFVKYFKNEFIGISLLFNLWK